MSDLDRLLKEYAARANPSPPRNFEDTVWREIHLRREAPSEISFFDRVAARLWRKHFTYASAVAAVVVGAGLAWFDLNASARSTSHALNLEVFSDRSPTLRLTSLSQNR